MKIVTFTTTLQYLRYNIFNESSIDNFVKKSQYFLSGQ